MADVAVPAPKVKKAAKPKKPATHPKYSEMIAQALKEIKSRGGCSRAALLKYILANFNVGSNQTAVNAHLKLALKAGVKNGALKQSKGVGAAGSFKLGEKPKAAKPKKAKKPKAAKPKKAAKKPAAKKTAKKPAAKKTPKKTAAKKATKPKAKTPKKAAAKPKKAATKSPKKAKAKPKKAKTPKKAAK